MEHQVFERVREAALSIHGVSEGTSYGTPAFKVKDKLLARLHEDGETLVMRTDFETRDFLLQVEPHVYFITDHYRNYPYILVRLEHVEIEALKGHLWNTWYNIAPQKLIQAFENTKRGSQDNG